MVEPDIIYRKFNLNNITFSNYSFIHIPDVIYINRVTLPENYSRYIFVSLYRFFENFSFVAIDQEKDKVIGYILNKLDEGKSFFDEDRNVKKGHVFSIAVLPKYRRRGIGIALLSLGLDAMFSKGIEEVYLEVRISNRPAIKLYELFGMGVVGVVEAYYVDGEDANVMAVTREKAWPLAKKIVKYLKENLKIGEKNG